MTTPPESTDAQLALTTTTDQTAATPNVTTGSTGVASDFAPVTQPYAYEYQPANIELDDLNSAQLTGFWQTLENEGEDIINPLAIPGQLIKDAAGLAGKGFGYAEPFAGAVTELGEAVSEVESVWDELTDWHTWASIGWLLLGINLMVFGALIMFVGEIVHEIAKAFGGGAKSTAKSAAAGAAGSAVKSAISGVAEAGPEVAVAAL